MKVFPHYGQYKDEVEILDCLENASYRKKYLMTDNTGSRENNGEGKLDGHMKEILCDQVYELDYGRMI